MSPRELARELGPLQASIPGREGALPLAVPETESELVKLITRAAEAGLKVLPIGAGSRLGGTFQCEADLVLSTQKLSGVTAYEPGDGTITALAGTRMSSLAAHVIEGGHRLSPDVPRPETATLGGVLADGLSGGDRLRFGPARHHVLGMRVLLANGTITKTGGRLVKNVTGFDMHRLYAGSGGSLCVILEATMRLFPAPSARAFGELQCSSLEEALELCFALSAPPLEPTAITLSKRGEIWTLTVTLDGRKERVKRELSIAEERAPRAEWSSGSEADAAHERERDSAPREGVSPALRVSARPSKLHAILEIIQAEAPNAHLLAHPAVGTLELSLDEGSKISKLVSSLRGASAVVSVRGASDDAGPRETAELEMRLRRALDPEAMFCGRP